MGRSRAIAEKAIDYGDRALDMAGTATGMFYRKLAKMPEAETPKPDKPKTPEVPEDWYKRYGDSRIARRKTVGRKRRRVKRVGRKQ